MVVIMFEVPCIAHQHAKLVETRDFWIDTAIVGLISTIALAFFLTAGMKLGLVSGTMMTLPSVSGLFFGGTGAYAIYLAIKAHNLGKEIPAIIEMQKVGAKDVS